MSEVLKTKESKNFLKEFLKSSKVRSTMINIFWKVFHEIISKWNSSLEETSKAYLERNNINLKIKWENELEKFKKGDRWLIIATHSSWNFADYLPIFAELWDEILKKSVFYTGAYNKKMNEVEFPDYTFRAATLEKKEDVKKLIKNIENDIEKVSREWWYIFIIPAWESTEQKAEFKSIFKRFVDKLDDNISVLTSRVIHEWNPNYINILRWKWFETELVFKNMKVSNFKWRNWKEMREVYNENLRTDKEIKIKNEKEKIEAKRKKEKLEKQMNIAYFEYLLWKKDESFFNSLTDTQKIELEKRIEYIDEAEKNEWE